MAPPDMKLVDMQPAATPKPKVARVEIELDDGTVMIWKGEAALKYIEVIDGVLALHQVRTGTTLAIPDPSLELHLPGVGGNPQKE